MERKPLSFVINVTVSGGSGSNTTPINSAIANAGGYIKQVIVTAPFDTATFDFRIANPNGRNVFKRTQQVGEVIEECETPLPAGIYTVYFSKCSHPGSHICELIFAEVY